MLLLLILLFYIDVDNALCCCFYYFACNFPYVIDAADSPSVGAPVDAAAFDAFVAHGVVAFSAAFVGIGAAVGAAVSASCASCVFDFFMFFIIISRKKYYGGVVAAAAAADTDDDVVVVDDVADVVDGFVVVPLAPLVDAPLALDVSVLDALLNTRTTRSCFLLSQMLLLLYYILVLGDVVHDVANVVASVIELACAVVIPINVAIACINVVMSMLLQCLCVSYM